jgi:hypothetical protein
MAACLGSAAAFAQTPRMPSMPAPPSLPSLPGAPRLPSPGNMSGATLGAISPNLGGLSSPSALGSITVCPTPGVSGAATVAGPLPSTLSVVSAAPASPILTPQTITSSAVAAPLAIAPLASPSIISPFGTTALSGACLPTILGDTPTSASAPPQSLIQSVYSNAGTPLQTTEALGGGLSPLIEVPPPVLYSTSGTVPNSSGVIGPTQ